MNKIVNKALFYKEWINVQWVTLLIIIILLLCKFYGVITLFKYNTGELNNRWFNNGLYEMDIYYFVMVLVVIALAIILFKGEKTSETQGFIASMPFTRKEIIFNKWFVGVVSIITSFVVIYIILSLIYIININNLNTTLNPYSDIIKWFFMDVLQYICIFTFMILIQVVMGNSIVAGIVGGIILWVPSFVVMVVQSVAGIYLRSFQNMYILQDKIVGWINIYSYNIPYAAWVSPSVNNSRGAYRLIHYVNYKSKLLVLFILICLFLHLSYVAYKKRDLEYNLSLIVFDNLKPIFTWGFAFCLGILIGYIFLDNGGVMGLRELGIIILIFTIIGYFIARLLVKMLSSGK